MMTQLSYLTYEWFNTSGTLGTANPLTLDPTMGVDGDTIDWSQQQRIIWWQVDTASTLLRIPTSG